MSREQYDYAKNTIIILDEMNTNFTEIQYQLESEHLSLEEKEACFSRLSGGLSAHLNEDRHPTSALTVVDGARKMILCFLELLHNPEIDKQELFSSYFEKGNPCFEARLRVAQKYYLKKQLQHWESLSPDLQATTPRPPDLDIVVEYSRSRMIESILGDEVVAFQKIHELNPSRDIVRADSFKTYLMQKEKDCLGFIAKNGVISEESIDAFIAESVSSGIMIQDAAT